MNKNYAGKQKIPLRRSGKPARHEITPDFLGNRDLGCGRYKLGRPFIGPTWYCASLNGGPKDIPPIIAALQRAGFDTHLPMFQPPIRDPDKPPRWRQLFPGYVFLNFDRIHRWQSIFSIVGVKKFFMTLSGTPLPIEPIMVQLVDLACRNHGEVPAPIIPKPPRPTFQADDAVVITEGPLAQMQGIVRMSDAERSIVALTLFGGRPFDQTFNNSDLRKHIPTA